MRAMYVLCLDVQIHVQPNIDFQIRIKTENLFDVWLQLVRNPNLLELDPKRIFTNYHLCRQRFTANDKSSNMFLVRTAATCIGSARINSKSINLDVDVESQKKRGIAFVGASWSIKHYDESTPASKNGDDPSNLTRISHGHCAKEDG